MNLRDRIAVMLSMTRTEITVVSGLLLFFLLGIIVNSSRSLQEARSHTEKEGIEQFTDAEVDSLLKEAALLETALDESGTDTSHSRNQGTLSTKKTALSQKIVFSKATTDELATIPGISTVLAGRLIAFRESRKVKVEGFPDFLEVKGIGKKRMETLEKHLILE